MAVNEIRRSGVIDPPRELVGLAADTKPTATTGTDRVTPWSTYRELDTGNVYEFQTRDGSTWAWQLI
ncbi:MAG: hypothetical protein Q8880_06370 [Bacteroidota bacterium]|nr:hypothetical protein [Bacteroidota bacterium]